MSLFKYPDGRLRKWRERMVRIRFRFRLRLRLKNIRGPITGINALL
jgi:hypothetical protein